MWYVGAVWAETAGREEEKKEGTRSNNACDAIMQYKLLCFFPVFFFQVQSTRPGRPCDCSRFFMSMLRNDVLPLGQQQQQQQQQQLGKKGKQQQKNKT
jgi:hypothetical protein